MAKYKEIKLSEIAPPPAPVRAVLDDRAIIELADSIRDIGLQQPLIVVSLPKQGESGNSIAPESGVPSPAVPAPRYEIVAGHRRYLACKHLGLARVACMVYERDKISPEAVMLHENVYRVDLTAAEEGLFYAELIDKHDLTEEALCKMVRQSAAYIYARLDLVRGDAVVLRACLDRTVNFSVAKELNRCEDEASRRYFLSLAVNGGATAATVRDWVERIKVPPVAAADEGTGQEQAGEAGQDPASGLRCFFCGGDQAPHHLVLIYIHFYELEVLRQVLAGIGIQVAG